MRNISEPGKPLPVEYINPTSASNKPGDLDLHNPTQLSHYLENSVFEADARFSVAQQNQCGKLKANTPSKLLVLSDISLCVGVAFHSKDSNT